jgi:hypothetical protein
MMPTSVTLNPRNNNTFSLDWRAHYTTQPVQENKETKYLCKKVPEKRIVWTSGSHMTPLFMVCRQIYDEVGLIPYSTNEFSFCSPYAFRKWLSERLIPQCQATKVLWLDNEWAGHTHAPDTLKDLSATLKISRLAWKNVSKAYWEVNKDRGLENCPLPDLDADMDNFAEFEDWLDSARNGGKVTVEYVKE